VHRIISGLEAVDAGSGLGFESIEILFLLFIYLFFISGGRNLNLGFSIQDSVSVVLTPCFAFITRILDFSDSVFYIIIDVIHFFCYVLRNIYTCTQVY
jgi:hypothetical protein